jgi:hypothetical protein
VSEPTVCAVMLTADRPELARRAVECFRAQTYGGARLCVLDTGRVPAFPDEPEGCDLRCGVFYRPSLIGMTIGGLRNFIAKAMSQYGGTDINPYPPDIFLHFDDDDWSHPNRIAEQVALLQSSGADCVGYREMLFWREEPGEAWLYSNPDPRIALGTSLCYWRRTWERKPFDAVSHGEDAKFITGLDCVGMRGIADAIINNPPGVNTIEIPRMVGRIHPGNTSDQYVPALLDASNRLRGGPWRRVPEWDGYARSVME